MAPGNQPRLAPAQELAPLLDEPGSPQPKLNRTQVLVLAFFAAALVALVAILAPSGGVSARSGWQHPAERSCLVRGV